MEKQTRFSSLRKRTGAVATKTELGGWGEREVIKTVGRRTKAVF